MSNIEKRTAFIETSGGRIFSYLLEGPKKREDNLSVVLLHGAGQSTSERYSELAELFAAEGIRVVALDFVGHGRTGGETHENSLALRTKHTLAAIDHWLDETTPLILCGSSMSGHTALRVSRALGNRVKYLCLLQPAVFAAEAEDVSFGPQFSEVIRRPGSWKNSLALDDAANFEGKALVAVGADDHVIPRDVIDTLYGAFKDRDKVKLNIIEGVGHELPTWLPHHPDIANEVMQYLTS